MTEVREPSRFGGARRGVRLLEHDPELGQLLDPERLEQATHELVAQITAVEVGEWDGARLAGVDPVNLGLVILEGVLAREVVLEEFVSTELLGPGDIIRPWPLDSAPALLPVQTRWNALSPARLALLDQRAAAVVARYPEINAVIVDRLVARSRRLAIEQAISQMKRVDDRMLALFWHLAERFGRVVPDGVQVPLVLSHRLVGELVGAARPSVSTALADLTARGELTRREDGTWLLLGHPPAVPDVPGPEVIRQRRRLTPARTRRASG